ncbi:flagellar hook protein FlgE [Clostridium tepidiprofundi DSM 19306]|uniref:Flagellar hook protein FlgE n=1 Tax=Clostridium tepidiprofundi DSM 19306 TaxID=1121338 RepID=A0A151B5N6_9CLOT|nr:flagellar hook-basal body complex protein [Clostridium tepidiprofundi]KYH35072.1 flagellar hook protein FlgE [Clostridium tepidiprofundi DSM 19306]
MLRSLYSGISGMKVNQTKLDVIGNNVANVGTTAFKASRVRFQDMLSQNLTSAIAPGLNQGGTNPSQVGLGVRIAGIDSIMKQGFMQPSGRNLDVAIDGEGYLMVGRGKLPFGESNGVEINASSHTIGDSHDMKINYTRDGSLTLDYDGNLLTSDGYRVLGYALTGTTDKSLDGESISVNNRDSIDYANYVEVAGKKDPIINFVNADDPNLKVERNQLIPLRIPDSLRAYNQPTKFSAPVNMKKIAVNKSTVGSPKVTGIYTGDVNAQAIFVRYNGSDFQYRKEGDESWTSIDEDGVDGITIDTTGVAATNGDTWVISVASGKQSSASEFSSSTAMKDLDGNDGNCNISGKYIGTEPKTLYVKCIGDASNKKCVYSFDGENWTSKQYDVSKTFKVDGITVDAKNMDVNEINEITLLPYDTGYREQKVMSFSIEKNGIIKAVMEDGSVSALGQIAKSIFKNPAGLKKLGKNLYQNTANSGVPNVISGFGCDRKYDNSHGYGDMLQGMLEMSNVDLAEQFTDMIVTSRAFQASSKMISTGDEILQDIINLKR